jgi:23S rRNA pseudouridine2605 synthase
LTIGNRVPLERALSKLGLASRTEARELIVSGRVKVDGRRAKDPRALVVPERVRISIDGQAVGRATWRLVLLHKPRGVVTTKRDPEGRPTVYDCLRGPSSPASAARTWLDRLVPVGRLDLASTGLLLLTSDTRLADWLTDPRNVVVRRYVVTIRGALRPEAEATLTPPATVTVLKRSTRETHLIVELTEGKNREIRRMFEAIGHEVTRLKRIAFGGLELGNLRPGQWREVSRKECGAAFSTHQAPTKHQAPARTRHPAPGTRHPDRATSDTDSR